MGRDRSRPRDRLRRASRSDVDAITVVPAPINEPVHDYAPHSPERARLKTALAELSGGVDRDQPGHRRRAQAGLRRRVRGRPAAPARLGDRPLRQLHPRRRRRGDRGLARPRRPAGATCPSTTAPPCSSARPTCCPARGARRSPPRPCSGQSKTAYQAEIDTPCELIDFWRFNVALRPPDPRRPAGLLARRLEPRRLPPARGLRLRDHAVQLHRDRRQPADRARADGQRRGLEAVADPGARRRT